MYGTDHLEYALASSSLTIFTSFTPEGAAMLCKNYLSKTADSKADLLSSGIEPSLAKRAINSAIMSFKGYETANETGQGSDIFRFPSRVQAPQISPSW
eukprot:4444440-Heterocapsa_arctica.AAC.1